jgi:biopolymer transport protein ExbB
MLATGIEHIDEPKDLVEEVMYEEMLTTRMSVSKLTPFLAVCASTAPLMGLLGTVTGIINTFKLITVFGSGDVKTLSGGISEALITTELGLVVAISALVLYAFLSRKAKSITDNMEQIAILFMNRATRSVDNPVDGEQTLPNAEPVTAGA